MLHYVENTTSDNTSRDSANTPLSAYPQNGYPTRQTVDKLYDEMDFQRATQAYL
ncbi:MAG: hypothetical protein N5P05_004639 (plasmid) [Chroococcopsis gigantea SAG 12.99]|nr:hypothetical protein [Chroococcopsis gigantea SAG 12.99]